MHNLFLEGFYVSLLLFTLFRNPPIEASSMTSMLKEKEEPGYFAGLNKAQLEG